MAEPERTGLEIAVIGMSGRFPGARNIDEFWENLKNGVESLRFFTEQELQEAGVEPGLLENPHYVKAGGGVLEDVEYFDAAFFDYTPNEALVMDPQVRIFHECVWEALEHAGYDPDSYKGKIGLYAGASSSARWENLAALSGKADEVGRFAASTLANRDSLSTRISYRLNLKGPSFVMQTACSTSLVAIDLACRGILTGLCDMALAGGVSVSGNTEKKGYLYKEGMIRSPDGHCRAFDAKAKGTVSGEGAGVVLLKLLEDAIADSDTIHAVIKGLAINNDGNRKVGYTAPSIEGQAEVIRAAHLMAEVDPETITYVETHGTGTTLGDPVEIEALKQGFGTDKKGFCRIGSLKTNIGHLDAAAGVGSFIKAVLALKHRQIPPSLHFETPNPGIDFENSSFIVNTTLTEWKSDNNKCPLRAGVSSFGIGGTNAHVVLEAWSRERGAGRKGEKPEIILLSAKTETALDKMTENLRVYLKNNPVHPVNPQNPVLPEIAYTLQVGRRAFKYRRALVCSTGDEAVEALSSLDSEEVLSSAAKEHSPPVIFMFPGQGSQYVNMGLELYKKEPVFRQEMDRCFEILKPLMDCDIKKILYPGSFNRSYINQTEIAQPLIFTIEYALAKLLMRWGFQPYAMIGHSIGEYTAACLSGVFSLEDALKIVALRGTLMQQLPSGAMMGISISEEALKPFLKLNPELSLAAVNSLSNCTVSGPHEAVEAFERQMTENRYPCRPLHTSHAFHSAMMDPILNTFEEAIKGITLGKPKIPYISNITGTWITVAEAGDPSYWAKHLREAVRFSDGIKELSMLESAIFIEVGPGRVLTTFAKAHTTDYLPVNLMRHPREEVSDCRILYREIGRMWLYGKTIDWHAFHEGEQGHRVPLPTYPFERQRYWIDESNLTIDYNQLMKNGVSGERVPLADWFYLPNWTRTLRPAAAAAESGRWLVFLDNRGLGTLLTKRLQEQGYEVVTVTAGSGFEQPGPNSYTIDHQQPGDYQQLFHHLASQEMTSCQVLHLWTLTGEPEFKRSFEQTQAQGFYSLLYIARAARSIGPDASQIRLTVISDYLHDVTGQEELDPGKSTMWGPLTVIPQEYPNIRCRSIDIVYPAPGSLVQDLLVDQLFEEITTSGEIQDTAVAFRGPHRLVQTFEPLHLQAVKREQLPLREKGIYLITGGFGRIGFILARYLAGEYSARLVLISRFQPGQEKIQELEALGAEVLAFAVDAADREQMAAVIAQVEQQWGAIQGVIHAAGIVSGTTFKLIDELEPGDCQQQFRPKVFGTLVLEELFRDKPLDFCWLMSSVSTVLGGLQFAAYAAANAFMDALVARLKRSSPARWLSIDWDGMPPEETVEAFKRILSLHHTHVHRLVVSTGGNLQARIRQWVKFESLEDETTAEKEQTAALHPSPQYFKPYAAPATKVQEAIAEIWQRIFGFEKIGIRDDFLELGGDSLKAITAISTIHKQLKVEIPLPVFFSNPTVEKLAEYVESKSTEVSIHASIPAAEKKEYYPLSSAQKRLYFLQQIDLSSTGYNMPLVHPLGKDIEKDRLEIAVKKLIARHESLRTSFQMIGDEPFQKIHDDVEFKIRYYDLSTSRDEIRAEVDGFVRPFDLSRVPLIRSGLIKLPDARHIWLLDIHHIVSDGTSLTILAEDFTALYNGVFLEPLQLQYKDFTQWQNRLFVSDEIKSQEDYWLRMYSGEVPRLNLLTDYKRPEVFTFAGDRCGFRLEPEKAAGFRSLGAAAGGTLYMNILAALNTLFFRYTGQTDIIIGSGIAGRSHADLHRIVGMFINTLAMRNYPEGEKTYRSFLKEVIAGSVQAFENQDVQFEELVDRLEPERDPSRNPLFDISMVVQNFRQVGAGNPTGENKNTGQAEVLPAAAEGLLSPGLVYRNPTSKFDMTIFVHEAGEDVHMVIEYYTGIFKRSTIERFAAHFKNVIQAAILEPGTRLKDFEIITGEEKRQVLYEFNDTTREFPKEMTIHALFERQVEKTPNAAALVYEDRMVTYCGLDARANRLARYLYNEKGMKPRDRVGVWISPSLERVTAILGILKFGGGYIPIDASLPTGRIEYMLNDAGIGVVLSEKRFIRDLERLQWECKEFHTYLCLDSFDIHAEEETERNELMDEELWHHVGETAVDDITGGGWVSSYTGEPLSREEMDEYGDNILKKLEPLLHPEMRVLEIGCASGISMFRIAPKVGAYYGTDLSAAIIARNKKIVKQKGYQNITLSCLPAHEIDEIKENPFDLVIMNSVIQCFHGHNYLRKVIKQCIDLLGDKGYLFIGDIMDLEKKKVLVRELMEFKRSSRGKGYTTKIDFSAELFIARGFWKDLKAELKGIEKVEFSQKIYTIENELTKFRYDILVKINKKAPAKGVPGKTKYQEDLRVLSGGEKSPLNLSIQPFNPAYIIYTSGTTGIPKGVVVEHRSVVNLSYWHNRYYKVSGADHAALYAGFGFDASVWELFPYLLKGAVIHVLNDSIKLDIPILNRYFQRHHITISFLPTQFCEQFLLSEEENRSLRVLLTGGDKLRVFTRGRYVLYNNYGPTENTVVTTAYPVVSPSDNIPIGKPVDNCRVYILAKDSLNLQPMGAAGELCIAGDSLARGYLNNPELTAEKFNRSYRSYRTYIFYKTGDLVRWLPDGNIEFLGRIDQQVKIRGFRIELGEIENHLMKRDDIKEVLVTAGENETGDKYLCAYVVPHSIYSIDSTQLREYLAGTLPGYMIPSYFVELQKVPLTPSGKVDRKALPKPGLKAAEDYVVPRDDIEKKLARIWSEILGVEEAVISIDDNFFNLGGHSLKATILAAKVHKKINIKVPLVEIFKTPTIRGLSGYIKNSAAERYASIQPVEKKEFHVLSPAQKRLYILQQMEVGNIVYNMTTVLELEEEPDRERLQQTFMTLIRRHESLRTSFHMINEEPVQKIHPQVDFEIEFYHHHSSFIPHHFIRSFDLSQAPLLRVGLVILEGRRYILIVDIHHIVSDGVSQGVLVKEFQSLYSGEELAPLRLQYKDYAEWLNRKEQREAVLLQEAYWLGTFAGEVPVLNLPLDYPRPAVQSFEGSALGFSLTIEETRGLKTLASQVGATLYMVLAALFNILLAKLSGQEDIVLGTITAGRRHADLECVIGMFVNTLPLRNYPNGQCSFVEFLKEVKKRILTAFENQEYPFEDLVENVEVMKDASRNPLFDVMFTLQNMEDFLGEMPEEDRDKKHQTVRFENRTAKFDLTLQGVEIGERLRFSLEYCTRLFKEETVKRFISYFKKVVTSVLQDSEVKLSDIEIISEQEKHQLLYTFNDMEIEYPKDKTIHQLFEEQVQQTPDGIAICMNHMAYRTYITYDQLNEKSNRLASLLQVKGVRPDTIIGLMVDRSVEMIIGILGILKAGCAYVPLNPRAPLSRNRYMLEECSAKVLVSDVSKMSGDFEMIDLAKIMGNIGPIGPIECGLPIQLAYIIFTSGSTGKPKGVPISHANLCPLLHWGYRDLRLGPKDRFIQNLSYYFDWSVWEIFMALTTGASLYMVPEELLLNPEACIDFMSQNKITVLHVTPTQYQYFVHAERKLESLHYLFIGAEKLSRELLARSFESVNRECRVFNMYGPTECTIISSVLEIERSDMKKFENLSSVPIGGPKGNTNLLVLDKYMKVCPVNVTGELYIDGDGVARGYLNNPELSGEKFVISHLSLVNSHQSLVNDNSTNDQYPMTNDRFYKTGDLARRLADGIVEFLGRIDHQVKIRGFRIELGEIESHLSKHPAIREAVVLALEGVSGEKHLCAYITAWRREQGARREGTEAPTAAELEEYLSQFLPDYMIPSHFIPIAAIPLTPNGKLDRKALPVPEVQEGEEYAAPTNEIEETLISLWSDLLNINKGNISVHANFFQLGGHSLKASMMTSMIHKTFNVKIPLVELFRRQTIRELAALIKESKKDLFMDIEPVEKREYYDISYNQKRLWLFYKKEPNTIAFNMPGAVTLKGSVNVQIIKQALGRLTERHESLRTAFFEKDGKVYQQVKESVEVALKLMDISYLEEEEKTRRYGQIMANVHQVPFDLCRPPLFRAALVKRTEEQWGFIYNLHHIINDGWSQQVLNDEFAALYQALQAGQEVQLEPLPLQYKDFVAWQKQLVSDPGFKEKSLRFWRERLGDGKPVLQLPADVDGSPENRAGAGYYSMMDEHLKKRLSELAKQHNISLAAVMFSTFLLLFSEFAKQEEIDCTLIDAGRDHVSMSRIMGFFIHRLFFKTWVEAAEPFIAFLSRINREVIEMLQYKSYPLERVCQELEMERPDSAIAFNMLNINDISGERKLEPFAPYFLPEVQDIKFDIEIYVTEYCNGLQVYWAFRKSLFSAETAAYIAAEYNRITEYFAQNPGMNLDDYRSSMEKISILKEESKCISNK